jgi:hypothetical protein
MNFIQESFLKNIDVCDQIIKYYKESNVKNKGGTIKGVNEEIKKCTEIYISDFEVDPFKEYFSLLQESVNSYIAEYPVCNMYSPWKIIEDANVQHYLPGEAFYNFHSERVTALPLFSRRHLVFMTYLNDVTDAGETEFYHQKVKVTPQKGKTLIWPADWTHTHRGIPSPTQEKYIITGWFSYYEELD